MDQQRSLWRHVTQQTLYFPSSIMSSRSVTVTSRFHAWRNTDATSCRFDFRSYCFLCVIKLMFMLPMSWNTLPPPLLRRATAMLRIFAASTLTSFQTFWWRPITTQGWLRQSSRIPFNKYWNQHFIKKSFTTWILLTFIIHGDIFINPIFKSKVFEDIWACQNINATG